MLTADWVKCLFRAVCVKLSVLAAATKVRSMSGESCICISITFGCGYHQMYSLVKWVMLVHMVRQLTKKEVYMLEKQVELQEQIHGQWNRYKALMPHIAKAYEDLPNQAYTDGVISGKMKRSMAMAAATIHGCRACILYQADEALKLGASKDDFIPKPFHADELHKKIIQLTTKAVKIFSVQNKIDIGKEAPMDPNQLKELIELEKKGLALLIIEGGQQRFVVHKNIQNKMSHILIGEGKELFEFLDRGENPATCHLYKCNM
jgi:alkylhydroperoxidase/carboxymuconolactone decarboxylase family protein YurZ